MCGVSYILSRESLRSCKTRFDACKTRLAWAGTRDGVPAEGAWGVVHVAFLKHTTDLLQVPSIAALGLAISDLTPQRFAWPPSTKPRDPQAT